MRARLNRVWSSMNQRCYNPNNKSFHRYGGRGIKISAEWPSYKEFKEWALSSGYKEGLTIDRINNDGDYGPDNCRWVTHKEQNRNYSRNRQISYNGETHCLQDWSEITGINRATIVWRINNGEPLSEVFSKGDRRYGKHIQRIKKDRP